MYKKFQYGSTALSSLLAGAHTIYKTVATTFGPFGKYVIAEQKNLMPKITKDGVSVAREIKLRNQFHEMAAKSLRDIAVKTVDRAGDGTTSSIILGYHLLKRGLEEGLSPFDIQELKKFMPMLNDYFTKISINAKNPDILEGVAMMASNGDEEISSLIKEGVTCLGENGQILVEEARTLTTFLEKSEGMLFNYGYSQAGFCNKEARRVVELDDPYILIHDNEIMDFQSIKPLFMELLKTNPERSIVIIAKKMSFYAEAGMLANKNTFKSAAINLEHANENFLKDLFIDLSTICGGGFISKSVGKELGSLAGRNAAALSDLGCAKKIIIHQDRTLIIPHEDNLEKIEEARKSLLAKVDACADIDERAYFNSRLSRMSEGVAIIKIGGLTEQATKERADRVEDAVCAVHAARRKGVIPGACVAFDYAAEVIKNSSEGESKAKTVLIKSLEDLSDELFKHTGKERFIDPDYESKILYPEQWLGMNFRTMEIENLFDSMVLDATAVIIETIQNSIDVASSLLMVDAAIVIERETDNLRLSTLDENEEVIINL